MQMHIIVGSKGDLHYYAGAQSLHIILLSYCFNLVTYIIIHSHSIVAIVV